MPEGDTIHRIEARLAPRLTGKQLLRVTTQGLVRGLAGKTVTSVVATGKHLVIELDDGMYIRAHLGMNGRFRAYDRARGDAILAKMSPGRASLAITTDDAVYLWVTAPTIEISPRRAPRHGMAVQSLGPDVVTDDFDPAVAAQRAIGHADRRIADVLLDQRIVAGIGNIYKSESLFAVGIDPRTKVAQLDAPILEAIYAAAHRLMRASVAQVDHTDIATRRADTARAPFAVYTRTGQPCPRCQAPIACYPLGDPPRWTWSCPTCQPAGPAVAR